MKFTNLALAAMLPMSATAAMAQEAPAATPAVTITGSAALVSDYRFRGVSQSDSNAAVQGSINLNHESGFYVGTWASSIELVGYGGTEVDLYGGFRKTFDGTTLDVGVLYYYYPGGSGDTDFVEPYASVTKAFGPVTGKLGVAYAPSQKAEGSSDNVYGYGELGFAIPNTPVTLKGHFGYSDGDGFLAAGVNGGKSHYIDYSVGADFVWRSLTFNVSYADTDISRANATVNPGNYKSVNGGVVVSLTAGF